MKKLILTLVLSPLTALAANGIPLKQTISDINPHLKKTAPLEIAAPSKKNLYAQIQEIAKKASPTAQDIFKLSEENFDVCSELTEFIELPNFSKIIDAQKLTLSELQKSKSWSKGIKLATLWSHLRNCEASLIYTRTASAMLGQTLKQLELFPKSTLSTDDKILLENLKKQVTAFSAEQEIRTGKRIEFLILSHFNNAATKDGTLEMESATVSGLKENNLKVSMVELADNKTIPFRWDVFAALAASIIDVTKEAPLAEIEQTAQRLTDAALKNYFKHMKFSELGLKTPEDLYNSQKMQALDKKLSKKPETIANMKKLFASFPEKEALVADSLVRIVKIDILKLFKDEEDRQNSYLKIVNAL